MSAETNLQAGNILPAQQSKEYLEKMKDVLEVSDEDLKRLNELVADCLESYHTRPAGQDWSEWLKNEGVRHARAWNSEDERVQDVKQIIDKAEEITATYQNFGEHIAQGKSAEFWIAKKIESGAKYLGIDTSRYAQSIKEALQKANKDVYEQLGKIPFVGGFAVSKEQIESGNNATAGQPAEWNDFTRIAVARDIKQLSLDNASANLASREAVMQTQEPLNKETGFEKHDFSRDLEESCKTSLNEAVNIGLGSAVAVALIVFSRGTQSDLLGSVPADIITAIVFDTLNKNRIMYQTANGSIGPFEVVDASLNSTVVNLGGMVGGRLGASVGAVVGSVFGPAGTCIGSHVGSLVGKQAGPIVAEKLYGGSKKVCSVVSRTVSSVCISDSRFVKGVSTLFS